MDTPTVADVKSDIKIFQNFSDDHITERINDAVSQVNHDQISDDQQARAIRAFARHLLYSDFVMNYGGVQSAGTLAIRKP